MIPEFELPHRLRRAREAAGYGQLEFARKIGVARSSLTNWENGHTVPKKIVINAWSLATGVPVEWLETGRVPAGYGDEPRAKAVGEDERARRDSNPQPSDWESPERSNVIPLRRRTGSSANQRKSA